MAKPDIKITIRKNKSIKLSASGEFKAQYAQEVKSKYLEVLNNNHDVELDLEEVSAFDVTAMQLTYLLKNEVSSKGRAISILLPKAPQLKALLENPVYIKFYNNVKENSSN